MEMKHSKMMLIVLVLISGLLVTSLGTQAQQTDAKGPNLSTDKGKEGGAATGVSVLNEAADLVRYARENESPIAMLAAVQMIERVRYQDNSDRLGAKKTDASTQSGDAKSDQAKGDQKEQSPAVTFDTQKLLAEAKGWAKGTPQLVALIDAEAAKHTTTGTLGATTGPIVHHDQVYARHYDDFAVNFYAGELARVAVVGDGDTDLDLYIYDANGNLIVADTDYSDRCLVQFVPRWTGAFRIRVVNNGYVSNRYVLMTN
jgi:hypothetical protein